MAHAKFLHNLLLKPSKLFPVRAGDN
jgi:hypothetical protein